MKLIIEPDDGVAPILRAIRRARRRLDVVIFRFDRGEVQRAIESAPSGETTKTPLTVPIHLLPTPSVVMQCTTS